MGLAFSRQLSNYIVRRNGDRRVNKDMSDYISIIDSSNSSPKADILKLALMEKGKDTYLTSYPAILNAMHTEWCARFVRTKLAEAIDKQKEVDSLFAIAKNIQGDALFYRKPHWSTGLWRQYVPAGQPDLLQPILSSTSKRNLKAKRLSLISGHLVRTLPVGYPQG